MLAKLTQAKRQLLYLLGEEILDVAPDAHVRPSICVIATNPVADVLTELDDVLDTQGNW